MPRRLRIALPNVPMHIIRRGNNRSCCFYAAKDYDLYLRTLAELAGRFACHIHAYVLMTNHVHLLLTPESREASSLLMKHLGQRYSQYVNRVYGRTGTLWVASDSAEKLKMPSVGVPRLVKQGDRVRRRRMPANRENVV